MSLIDLLKDDLEHPTKRNMALSPALQVFVAVRFYATGSVLDATSTIHGVSIPTASRTIRCVTQLLCQKRNEVSIMP